METRTWSTIKAVTVKSPGVGKDTVSASRWGSLALSTANVTFFLAEISKALAAKTVNRNLIKRLGVPTLVRSVI